MADGESIQVVMPRDRTIPLDEAIARAILSAAWSLTVGDDLNRQLAGVVTLFVEKKFGPDSTPSIRDIQGIVDEVLEATEHAKTARAYVEYRERRANFLASLRGLPQDIPSRGRPAGAPGRSRSEGLTESIQSLRDQVDGISPSAAPSALDYIASASRLAALGDASRLNARGQRCRPFVNEIPKWIGERCQKGMWDLRNLEGEDLGLSLIDAQDFHCFLALAGEDLPEETRRAIEAWTEETDDAPLDADTVDVLERFRLVYPIPDRLRLPVVESPVTDFEMAVLASLAPPRPTQTVAWPRTVPSELAESGAAKDVPDEALRAAFGVADFVVETEAAGPLRVSRRLGVDWSFTYQLRGEEGPCPAVELLRVGVLPGEQVNEGRWKVRLGRMSSVLKAKALRDPLAVNFANGRRLVIE